MERQTDKVFQAGHFARIKKQIDRIEAEILYIMNSGIDEGMENGRNTILRIKKKELFRYKYIMLHRIAGEFSDSTKPRAKNQSGANVDPEGYLNSNPFTLRYLHGSINRPTVQN